MRGGDPAKVRAALDRAAGGRGGPVNALGQADGLPGRGPQRRRRGARAVGRRSGGASDPLAAVGRRRRSRVVVSGPTVVHTDRAGSLVARDVAHRRGEVAARAWTRAFTRIGHAAGGDVVAEVVQIARRRRGGQVIGYDAASGSRRLSRDVDGPVGGARGVGVAGGGAPAVAVGDPDRRPQRRGAGRHPVARAGGHLRARPARGAVLRLARGVHGLGPHGHRRTGQGRRRRLPRGQGARRSSARCTTTTCTGRQRTTTRPSIATACCGGCSPPGSRPRFTDNAVVVHNFRFFFALDAGSGALRWAFNQPRTDAISSEHTGRQRAVRHQRRHA